jgi:16S rRNA (guanine527-N7)-methyltransferase
VSTTPEGLSALASEAARLGLDINEQDLNRFARYLALLVEWQDRAGLTSVTDLEEIQRRHFGESLALLVALRSARLVPSSGGSTTAVADIGTGGGFPGLPMRIVEPGIQLTLIEAQARRCRFLEAIVEALDLPDVRVVQARAEEAGRLPDLRGQSDLVVARALAALPILVEYGLPLLRLGGVLATPKGSRVEEEKAASQAAIATLGGTLEPSLALSVAAGAPEQQVVVVRRTAPLDDRFPRRAGIPAKRPLR